MITSLQITHIPGHPACYWLQIDQKTFKCHILYKSIQQLFDLNYFINKGIRK